jgi:endonuclease/exonuclease/phosphatase family metal-dependent hydrolase
MNNPSAPGCRQITVLTVNVHKGFTSFNRRFMLGDLRDALRRAAPDIVFLQEVLGEHRKHASRWPDWPALSQYEFLADSLWSDYAYGRNAVYPSGHHGNAILSRYPIQSFRNHDVSVGRHESRGMLHCVIRPPEWAGPLHAFCVHLGLRGGHRKLQLKRLCELATHDAPQDEPLIIAGDFNDWRLQANKAMARCGASEVYATGLGRCARSFPSWYPLLRLDRVYVRGFRAWKPLAVESRVWSRLSDHAPLCARVVL